MTNPVLTRIYFDRGSSEGMKVACTNFQCAAWSFHTIPDRFPQHTLGSDMSADLLAFLSQVRFKFSLGKMLFIIKSNVSMS